MRVLMLGMTFGTPGSQMGEFRSRRGHELRFLAAEGTADLTASAHPTYTFAATETAAAAVERIAAQWRPDALVCYTPELFPPPLEIEACPILTAALISDWTIYHAQLESNLARYDVVLSDRLGSQSLRLNGATPQYLFPLYSQCSRLHRKLDIEKDVDVAFVGNLNHAIHIERGRCLERIAALSDRYRILIATELLGDDYVRALNRARIVFNHALRREMNLRCFEALACGSLLFLERNNLEVHDYLRDREEVVLYTPDTLVPLLQHFLDAPGEAARIAAQGHAKAGPLALENRLDALFDWLECQPPGPRPFTRFPPAQQAFATIMQYASSLVDTQRDWAAARLADARRQSPRD
ncbi:MAG: glycosyltransferase family 1 protein, partial [Candidatus Hydrogenedentes bacterium]|nr:glycosyltransferase family 1 protein [Candidatus Hydrogenedentota bacterium]